MSAALLERYGAQVRVARAYAVDAAKGAPTSTFEIMVQHFAGFEAEIATLLASQEAEIAELRGRVAALEGALKLIPPSFIETFMSKRRWRAAASIDIKARKDSTEAWIEGDWLKPFIRAIAVLRPAETGDGQP